MLYASATFGMAISSIPKGSAARAVFEVDFKAGVVASMALGGVNISDSNVEIVAISAGSIIVDFEVSVPAAIQSQVATQFQTMTTNPSLLSVGNLESLGFAASDVPHERHEVRTTVWPAPAPTNSHASSTDAIMVGLWTMVVGVML